MNKRIVALLLALLTVSSVFASCKGNGEETTSTTDTTASDTNADGSTATDPVDDGSDNYAGTPAYTVEGDYIVVDGVKYPNNNNYNAGPLVAIDDLDRELPTAEESKTAITDGTKNVGIFYFLWLGASQPGDRGVYDINKIIEEGGMLAGRNDYEGWGPVGAAHHWGEPLYGYYYSNDEWVIRKHVEELTNAGVDFLYFDATNGFPYVSTAKKVMKVLSEMNSQGWDAPQVVFYTNTNASQAISEIYGTIYKRNVYPDTWFKIDGKPVLIAPTSVAKAALGANADFFTYRESQWPNEKKKKNAWPWMSFFRWDEGKDLYNKAAGAGDVFYYDGEADAINVSVAQHCGNTQFSSSALYNNRSNRGRSYHNGKNDLTENAYLYGYNFQEQWDAALAADVPYVLVTGWNEWIAQRQADDGNKVVFIDACTTEYSRDVEMMRGGYFDNYYMQLISNIRKYKGTAPTLIQNTRKKIDINGSFDQWNDILVTYSDLKGDTEDRSGRTFGKGKITDTSGRNDITSMKIVYDTKNAYFYVECADNITAADTNSAWMQLYINTDNAKSGWYGYDYIVNYKATGTNETSLAKCSADGKYEFTETAKVPYKIEGNKMMVSVPLSDLGITDYRNINFSFKWVDSDDAINTMEQMYTSGDQAPHGRLNFVFQNCK